MKMLWKQGSESRERKCVIDRDQILPTQGIYSLKKKNMSDGFIFGLHRMVVLAASCCVCIELMFLFQSISGHFIHSEGTKHIRVSYVAQLVKSHGGKF